MNSQLLLLQLLSLLGCIHSNLFSPIVKTSGGEITLATTSQHVSETVSSLLWKQAIVITTDATQLHILHPCVCEYFHISEQPAKTEIKILFDTINVRQPLNIIVYCKTDCLKSLFDLANQYDDLADQQGYFLYTHMWLCVTNEADLHTIGEQVGNIRNVLALSLNENSSNYHLNTAVQGLSGANEFVKVGSFDHFGLRNHSTLYPNTMYGFNGRHMLVSTQVWDPFVKKSDDGEYSGLCIDMLQTFSEMLNFSYSVAEPQDRLWGDFINGTWNGLVAEMINKRADIVVAAMTRSPMRSTAMDFSTQPFYIEYIAALFKSPGMASKATMLVKPFRSGVWLLIGASVLIAAIVTYVLCRFSFLNTSVKRNYADQFKQFGYCLLVTYGTLLAKGARSNPRVPAGRAFWGCWWFFGVIVMSTYCGNLVAFLTVSRVQKPFNTLAELEENNDYTYGTLGDSAMLENIRGAKAPLFIRMWEEMKYFASKDPDIMSSDHDVHLQKLRKENYVYFIDKTAVEFDVAKDCRLTTLDDSFETRLFYSVGLRKNSAYGKIFGDAILKIGSTGLFAAWKIKHWPRHSNVCPHTEENVTQAGFEELYSIFLILSISIAFATLILLTEIGFHWHNARFS